MGPLTRGGFILPRAGANEIMSKIETPSGIPEDDFLREGLVDRLQQYLAAEPEAWHVRYNLGVALMHSGRVDEALEHFRLVLKATPKHLESLVNIGGIHLSRGEADLAMKAFTTALSVWDFPMLRANLAVAYIQLGHLEDAERQLRTALEGNPEMPDALTNLSTVLMRTQRTEEAVEMARKALAVNDKFAMAYNNLAVGLLELGRPQEAAEAARQALDNGYPVEQGLLEELGVE